MLGCGCVRDRPGGGRTGVGIGAGTAATRAAPARTDTSMLTMMATGRAGLQTVELEKKTRTRIQPKRSCARALSTLPECVCNQPRYPLTSSFKGPNPYNDQPLSDSSLNVAAQRVRPYMHAPGVESDRGRSSTEWQRRIAACGRESKIQKGPSANQAMVMRNVGWGVPGL